MNQSQIDYEKTLSIWWSMTWRVLIFSTILGFIFIFIGGFVAVLAGYPEAGNTVGQLTGALVSVPVFIWALKVALSKKHKGYSVRLVRETIPADAPEG